MHAFMMGIWGWLAANPVVGLAVAAVLALLIWKQPRQTAKLAMVILALVAAGYLASGIAHFAMDSAMVKGRMIEKSQ